MSPEVGERGGGDRAEVQRRQAPAGELMNGVERGGHRLDHGVDEDEAAEPAQRPAGSGREGRAVDGPRGSEPDEAERRPRGERAEAAGGKARGLALGAARVDEGDQVPEPAGQRSIAERGAAQLDVARQRPRRPQRQRAAQERQLGGHEPGQGERGEGGCEAEGAPRPRR
jgi:hypothetical protein